MLDVHSIGKSFVPALVLCAAIGGAAVFGVLVGVVPGVVADCSQAGVELSLFAKWIFRLSALISKVWYFAGPIALLGPLPLLLLPRGHAAWVGVSMIAAQLGVALLTIVAMYGPYRQIAASAHELRSAPRAVTATASPAHR